MHKITMLGTGLIGMFYTLALHRGRGADRVYVLYSQSKERARDAAEAWGVEKWTTDLDEAINDPETDVVVVGLPNNLHKEAVLLAAEAGKAVLCTKPLARTAAEAREMLEAVERAGVFHGYLEDLVYTPKAFKAIDMVGKGAVGKVLWTRSRETHGGPHSAWFVDREQSGAAPSWTWGATASSSAEPSSARGTSRSRSCAGRTRTCTRSRSRITRSR